MVSFIHMWDMGCEFLGYLNYSVYFHTVSPRTVPSPTSNTKGQDTFNNRLVEKGNDCSIYLKLTHVPDKIKSFACFRLNVVYVVAQM